MALSSNEIKVKSTAHAFENSQLPLLSLRSIKGIVVGLIALTVLAFLVFWQPEFTKFQSLLKEKDYWLYVMSTEETNAKLSTNLSLIPTMDQLPSMIEKCRSTFIREGIEVVTFNVERFGENQETGKEVSLDYALVRLRLQGQWNGIVSSLKVLEEAQDVSIHVREVVLASDGGEVLLQIYFCSGE